MTGAPEHIALDRHRDLSGRAARPWARWAGVAIMVALAVAALVGAFGQRPRQSAAAGGGAVLEVSAPTKLRGGLYYQGRFRVGAERAIARPTLLLDAGWLESMQLNTIAPAPVREESREGRLALVFGRLAAGDELVAYLQFQVNPTNVGRRAQGVTLADGDRVLARVERTVTIYP